ncbi:PREDICTED: putative nuclease HARBI1 [Erythranthe guttata]|uniref:putative nuclease HARBI1 n=1 Tax=Erythranthe guttata TaxID=4155 RepID=UPI00064DBD9C|nr:PREDICTED: putative nuclease HARBI1 [Erythranthe guttata]|eukprot:XP_012839839.1 PREDICTED: putative nuclease HARBI1 [Erythranthe guttata]
MDVSSSEDEVLLCLQEIIFECVIFFTICFEYISEEKTRESSQYERIRYNRVSRVPDQVRKLSRIIDINDISCINNLRMSRDAFGRLCHILENTGDLHCNRNISISEQVAMFLHILAHHTKNRIVGHEYERSGRTVSKYFNNVLNAVIKLHPLFLGRPEPVDEHCTNERWKLFKGCLGALDGTYIKVRVSVTDKGRYRNRKGDITVNILGVCDSNMKFIYILSGWEGSAADSRVLRDAITKENGLRIPKGSYYLVDNGYTNGEGFLSPYRSVRYHLDEWGEGKSRPRNKEEFFNMKHSRARNVIERSFGLLKSRWGILRTSSHYPIKTHNRIIMACALLHNYIRTEMPIDPIEHEVPDLEQEPIDPIDYIGVVESTPQWSGWRDNLATSMYNQWRRR